MLLNRKSFRLALGVLVLLAGGSAIAQDLVGFQLFAPAEVTPYGGGPRPKEGYFFVFDGILWSISTPEVAAIGNGIPGQNSRDVFNVQTLDVDAATAWTQTNTHSTGDFKAIFKEGNRFEIGRITDRHGWMLGVHRLNTQTQIFNFTDVGVVFSDDDDWGTPVGGRLEGPVAMVPNPDYDPDTNPDVPEEILGPSVSLPVIFDDLTITNRVNHWSVELMYICRVRHCRFGGVMEIFAGARYMAFDERFTVETFNDQIVVTGDDDDDDFSAEVPGALADSHWQTDVENHIVGGQLGARWFKKHGRWMFSTEGRFLAGINYQNYHQIGVLGNKLNENRGMLGIPSEMLPTEFEHSTHIRELSPAIEARFDWRYQLTRSISFRAGWTGIWIGGLARPSNMIDYSLREEGVMGLLTDNNSQNVFIHGLTLGVDVNR